MCLQIADTGSGIENDKVALHNKGWGHGSNIVRDLSEQILAKLREAGGQLPLSDKSSPELIYATFGVSKKAYKQAIGTLYKEKKIVILWLHQEKVMLK